MLFIMGLFWLTSYSQEGAPQSPSVSGLMNFESNPVNLSTGVPSISIPLYTLSTRSKDISIPMSLSYHPSSVAVFREKEGNCGRGWTMSIGGSVTFNGDKSRKWKDLYEYLHDDDPDTPSSLKGSPAYGQFNFMGYSGKFEVKMNLNTEKLEAKVTENDDAIVDMKVVHNPTTYKITAFVFYDTKGYAYVFSISDTYVNVYMEELDEIDPMTGDPKKIERRINTASAYHLSHIYDTNEYNFDPLFTFGENSLTPGEPLAVFSYSDLSNQLNYHESGEANHIKMLSGIEAPGIGSVTFSGNSIEQNTELMSYNYSLMMVKNVFGKSIKSYSFNKIYIYDQLVGLSNVRLLGVTESVSGDEYEFSYNQRAPSIEGYSWNGYGYMNYGPSTSHSAFISDNVAKQGVLQKMTLPTGGCIIYDYELNTYSFRRGRRIDCIGSDSNGGYIDEYFFENDNSVRNKHNNEHPFDEIKKWYQGPGIRIKRIAHFDTDVSQLYYDDDLSSQYTPVKEISYDYTLPNESNMSSGSLSLTDFIGKAQVVTAYNYGLLSRAKIIGTLVNYSNVRVTSTVDNGGYIEYSFISDNQLNCLTSLEFNAVKQPDYKIGKVKNEKIYNAAGILQQETTYEYDFNQIANVEDPDSQLQLGNVLGWAVVTQINKKFYHPSGMIESTDNYAYYLNRKINTHSLSNSRGDVLTTKYYYNDLNSPVSKNRIQPEIVEQYQNQELLSTSKINYANSWNDTQSTEINNAYLPASTQVSKGNNPLITTVHFNRYDKYGHILEFEQEDGLKVAYIWGYQDSQIIAKIEGISSYTDIDPTLLNAAKSTTDSAVSTEAAILTALDNLRNDPALAGTVITTYTHIPLVGVSTITDARGYRTTYEYDINNRLKLVKDDEGNILSENEYHIKTQN